MGNVPWCDLKVAFSVESSKEIWDAYESGKLDLPSGWELNMTSDVGGRSVAVFRVKGAISENCGWRVWNELNAKELLPQGECLEGQFSFYDGCTGAAQ